MKPFHSSLHFFHQHLPIYMWLAYYCLSVLLIYYSWVIVALFHFRIHSLCWVSSGDDSMPQRGRWYLSWGDDGRTPPVHTAMFCFQWNEISDSLAHNHHCLQIDFLASSYSLSDLTSVFSWIFSSSSRLTVSSLYTNSMCGNWQVTELSRQLTFAAETSSTTCR